MQTLKPIIVTHLFPELLDKLINLLQGLTEEEWNYPTICTPWSVKEVCAHLLGGEMKNISWRRDGFSGFEEIVSFERIVQLVNEHNSRWVRSTQYISPELLINLIKFTGDQSCEFFVSVDPYKMGVPVDWIGPEPAPNWVDLAREYTERWHHQQHIRDAVDKPGLKEPKFLGPILDTFILGVPRTFQSVSTNSDVVIKISTTGSVIRDWVLISRNDKWQLLEGRVEHPSASVSVPDDIAWRIFTKEILPEDARKQVELSGNQELAGKVLDTISIIA